MEHDHYTRDEEFLSDFVFAPLLGSFMILWARIERAVDVCLANRHKLSSSDLYSSRANGGLADKLAVLKNILTSSDRLKSNVVWIEMTMQRIGEMSSIRNALIHGYLVRIEPGEPPIAQFSNKRPKEGFGSAQLLCVSAKTLEGWINGLRSLDGDLSLIVLAVATART